MNNLAHVTVHEVPVLVVLVAAGIAVGVLFAAKAWTWWSQRCR